MVNTLIQRTEICISTIGHTSASRISAGRKSHKAGTFSQLTAKFGRKTVRRRLFRSSLVAVNLLLVLSVLAFILHGRSSGASISLSANNSASNPAVANPLDQVSSSDIALTVSRMSGLNESTAIKNQAESDDTKLATAPTTNNVVSKPQVVATSFKSKNDIRSYVSQNGDSVSSLATKFNVTSDSIRWSNGITGDSIGAGTKLAIPPANYSGIVYTVKAGDTPDSLSQKYKADKAQLIAANDAEIKGLITGEQIIIPNGQLPTPPVTTAKASYYGATGYAWGNSAVYGGYNGYDYGYCTWWVAKRRDQVGMPLPSNLGNASSWPRIGAMAGLAEGNVPKQYAAVVTSTYGEGHVGFVESVNPDGSFVMSEMNHLGWAVQSTQTVSADQASRYIYLY